MNDDFKHVDDFQHVEDFPAVQADNAIVAASLSSNNCFRLAKLLVQNIGFVIIDIYEKVNTSETSDRNFVAHAVPDSHNDGISTISAKCLSKDKTHVLEFKMAAQAPTVFNGGKTYVSLEFHKHAFPLLPGIPPQRTVSVCYKVKGREADFVTQTPKLKQETDNIELLLKDFFLSDTPMETLSDYDYQRIYPSDQASNLYLQWRAQHIPF